MLVNATNMLLKARDGHYAVGQFNINNLEWTKSILLTAQEMNSPVILGVSEGAGKYMTGFKTVAAMVKAMDESLGITVPVALHLDHGTYEGAKACVACRGEHCSPASLSPPQTPRVVEDADPYSRRGGFHIRPGTLPLPSSIILQYIFSPAAPVRRP